ncbi:hypothetical protein NKH76_35160, partial [Mesorhizobium sp. M0965]
TRSMMKEYGLQFSRSIGSQFRRKVWELVADSHPLRPLVQALLSVHEQVCREREKLDRQVRHLAREDERRRQRWRSHGRSPFYFIAFGLMAPASSGAAKRWRNKSALDLNCGPVSGTRDVPAGTVVAAISVKRLTAVHLHLVGNVEAPDPNIIMRHSTSERTMTPAMAVRDPD